MNGPAEAVKRASQISEEIKRIDEQFNMIQAQLTRLEDRLTPILVSLISTPTDEAKKDIELVPLANYLRTKFNELTDISNRIESLCQRIEL